MTTRNLYIMLTIGTLGSLIAAWNGQVFIAALLLVPVLLSTLELDRRSA